ncbi:hypothetical protein HUJ04_005441 [Dendroctonus ponderosae]|nr:hypothetical protein HUJ04_005441 [Dendroctonus ponderosae]
MRTTPVTSCRLLSLRQTLDINTKQALDNQIRDNPNEQLVTPDNSSPLETDPRGKPLTEKQLQELADTLDLDNSDIEDDLLTRDNDVDEELELEQDLEQEILPPEDDGFDSEDDVPLSHFVPARSKKWMRKAFIPPNPPNPVNYSDSLKNPLEYFEKYISNDFFASVSTLTNMREVSVTGHSLETSATEIKKLFGCTMLIGIYALPRLRMFWAQNTRVPIVSDNITRNRFFKLRSRLKVVDDNMISAEEKSHDRFWKVRPLLDSIQRGCRMNERSPMVSIDEQMIPFAGQVLMKQFVRGKPNPVGLKNFVMTTPTGIPLDFYLYEGKGSSVESALLATPEKLDVGGRMVLKLTDTLPLGVFVFTDRYFTSIPLIDFLFSRKVFLAGTIMANRIPKNAGISSDNDLKKKKRGSYDQLVRDDGKISLVKWFDNKPVNLASSCMGVEPEAAGWLEYRENAKAAGLPRKEIMDFLDFKLSIAKSLILENQGEDDMEFEAEDDEQPGSKRRSVQPIPDKRFRDFRYPFILSHIPPSVANYDNRCPRVGYKEMRQRTSFISVAPHGTGFKEIPKAPGMEYQIASGLNSGTPLLEPDVTTAGDASPTCERGTPASWPPSSATGDCFGFEATSRHVTLNPQLVQLLSDSGQNRDTHGGGTAITIKKSIAQTQIPPFNTIIENTAIKLEIYNTSVQLISAYRPPNKATTLLDYEVLFHPNETTLLAGDLNSKHSSRGCKEKIDTMVTKNILIRAVITSMVLMVYTNSLTTQIDEGAAITNDMYIRHNDKTCVHSDAGRCHGKDGKIDLIVSTGKRIFRAKSYREANRSNH